MLTQENVDHISNTLHQYLKENSKWIGHNSYTDVSIITRYGEVTTSREYPNIIIKGPYYLEVVVVFEEEDLLEMMTGSISKVISRKILNEITGMNPAEFSKSIALEKLGSEKVKYISVHDFKTDALFIVLIIQELRKMV